MRITTLIKTAALVVAAGSASASVVYDFNSDAQGWKAVDPNTIFAYQSTGGIGNTGYIQTTDGNGGQMMAISPALGAQSALLGGTFSFGYNVFNLLSQNVYSPNNLFGTVRISSGSLFATADLIPNITSDIQGSGWHIASLGLTNSAWGGNAALSTVLADITSISITTEYDSSQRYPDEVVGLDDIKLTSAVPEPGVVALTFAGLAAALGVGRRRKRG